MKRYNIFSLYVVENEGHKLICERVSNHEYIEVLTEEKLIVEKIKNVKSLTIYYSILDIASYKDGQILNPLMLTKNDILLKYIEINKNVVSRVSYYQDEKAFLEKQEKNLEGLKVLQKECPELAKQIALETLQGSGILDEKGNLKDQYKQIVVKEEIQKQKVLNN